jgi:hypothetical protein
VTYAILNGLAWAVSQISGGRIVPYEYDESDYWSPRIQGGILPGWLKRLARGKRDFWREWNFDEQEEIRDECYVQRNASDSRFDSVDAGTAPRYAADFARTWEMPQLSPLSSTKMHASVELNQDENCPTRSFSVLPRSGRLEPVQEMD